MRAGGRPGRGTDGPGERAPGPLPRCHTQSWLPRGYADTAWCETRTVSGNSKVAQAIRAGASTRMTRWVVAPSIAVMIPPSEYVHERWSTVDAMRHKFIRRRLHIVIGRLSRVSREEAVGLQSDRTGLRAGVGTVNSGATRPNSEIDRPMRLLSNGFDWPSVPCDCLPPSGRITPPGTRRTPSPPRRCSATAVPGQHPAAAMPRSATKITARKPAKVVE